jgi:hypothetical protein
VDVSGPKIPQTGDDLIVLLHMLTIQQKISFRLTDGDVSLPESNSIQIPNSRSIIPESAGGSQSTCSALLFEISSSFELKLAGAAILLFLFLILRVLIGGLLLVLFLF